MTLDLIWQKDALCASENNSLSLFFADDDDPDKSEKTDAAISLCLKCPVRVKCLQYALDAEERFGVWGGSSEYDRRWALSVDQYGKPIQRTRSMRCPNCASEDILAVDKKRLKTLLTCSSCQISWWSRKLSEVVPITESELNDELDDRFSACN